MAQFRIGQRVRIVFSDNPTMIHYVGKEDVITGLSALSPGYFYLRDAIVASNGKRCSWHPDDLAPIQPSGYQVTTWSALSDLWQPEHLREVVK